MWKRIYNDFVINYTYSELFSKLYSSVKFSKKKSQGFQIADRPPFSRLFLTNIQQRVIKRLEPINQRRNQQSTVNWISFAPMSASFLLPLLLLRYTIKYKIEVWILAPVKIYGSRVLSIPVSRNF